MLKFRVLGSLGLVHGDGREARSVLSQPKRAALLAYLATARPGPFHRRDSLLVLFWPEADEEHARNALNQSLHFLRRSLGPDVIQTRGREEVGIARGELWCDVVAFRKAIGSEEWERALELYRGDLLDGFHVSDVPAFERWMDRERARLRESARDAAVELAREMTAPDDARRALRRALEIVPTDERVVRRLMRLVDEAGDRAAALRAYEELATQLERSLGTGPSAETRALARSIRTRRHRVDSATSSGADATALDGADTLVSASGEPTDARPATTARRRWPVYTATVLVLGVTGLVLAESDLTFHSSAAMPERSRESPRLGLDHEGPFDRRTIAVLPFTDLSDPPDDRLSAGLVEELLHGLSRSRDLRVIARTSSSRFAGTSLGVPAIGDSLGAGSVLEGSVRRSGDRVRISARLIDAGNGHQLWSGTYGLRLSDDLFEVQEEIARVIVDSLRVRLAEGSGRPSEGLPTSDLEAYSLYLRGRRAWNERTPASFRRAVELYEAALDRDPSFARVWGALAELYAIVPTSPNVSSLMPEFVTREGARRRARAAAERALALDEEVPQAHAALGQLLRGTDGDRPAEERFRRAIGIHPSYSTARQWLAFLLASHGRTGEAVEQLRTARLLDPFSVSINGDLGRFLYYAGDYKEAIRRLRRTLELGTYPQAERYLALALSAAGRGEEARELAGRLDPEVHGLDRVRTVRAVVATRSGREGAAREVLRSWKRRLRELGGLRGIGDAGEGTVLRIAWIHAALGEADSTRSWLNRIASWGPGAQLQIRNAPAFAAILRDPDMGRTPGDRGRGP